MATWAILTKNRPAILNQQHTDLPWPFKYLPRAINAFLGAPPKNPKPIPDPGTHIIRFWPWPYFALQTKSGWLIRFGFRWDDIDHYYDLGATIKHES